MKLFILTLSFLSFNLFAQEETHDYRHVVFLGIDHTTSGTFESKVDELTIDFENGFSVGYEYRLAPKMKWGHSFGVVHHLSRRPEKFTYENINLNDPLVVTYSNSKETVSVTRVYANLISRWDTFYIPFGLNYSFIDYSSPEDIDYISEGGTRY